MVAETTERTEAASVATEAPGLPDDLADARALLAELDGETPESTETSTEDRTETPAEDDPLQAELDAAAEARVSAEREKWEQERTQEDVTRQEQEQVNEARLRGINEAAVSYQSTQRAFAQYVNETGLSQEDATRLGNLFNSHHAVLQKALTANYLIGLAQEMESHVPESDRPAFRKAALTTETQADMVKEFLKRATPELRKGHVSEAEVKKRVSDGRVALLKEIQKDPQGFVDRMMSRTAPAVSRTGSVSTTPSRRTPDVDSAQGARDFLKAEGISIGR
jgi:hypothetical protein